MTIQKAERLQKLLMALAFLCWAALIGFAIIEDAGGVFVCLVLIILEMKMDRRLEAWGRRKELEIERDAWRKKAVRSQELAGKLIGQVRMKKPS